MNRLLAAFVVLVIVGVGLGAVAAWPWLFPQTQKISTGAFNGLKIGESKINLLTVWPDKSVLVASNSIKSGWVDVSKITYEQKLSLLKDNEWWLSEGWVFTTKSGCNPHTCPNVTLSFSQEQLSYVQVICHLCP